MDGAYSRAPRLVRPVLSSWVPPTYPRCPIQGPDWSRVSPKGLCWRRMTWWVWASMARVPVHWRSGIRWVKWPSEEWVATVSPAREM